MYPNTISESILHPPARKYRSLAPKQGERILLINPTVYDIRLAWVQWQQPTYLLKIAAYCREVGADVRLIDMMQNKGTKSLTRQNVRMLRLDNVPILLSRFGLDKEIFVNQMKVWSGETETWQPDKVFVECFTTFWWQGAAEAISCVRQTFPSATIILVGPYAAIAPNHARMYSGADALLPVLWPEADKQIPDLSVYQQKPNFAYVTLGSSTRSADEVLEEIHELVDKHDVYHFAFSDHDIVELHGDLYFSLLEKLAANPIKGRFYAFGNIRPIDMVIPEVAGLLRKSGYREITFADDRVITKPDGIQELIEQYREAIPICHEVGFAVRNNELNASICIGKPEEDLSERVRVITYLAHYVGSVIPWPYQPDPSELKDLALEEQNGKLFPFRERNGYSYRDYVNTVGLTTLLNARSRGQSFDFLGDGLIPTMLRTSFARQSWLPSNEVKGPLKLPMIIKS